jgi:hypothetical protein
LTLSTLRISDGRLREGIIYSTFRERKREREKERERQRERDRLHFKTLS